jgi:hypothetical protein
MQHQMDPQFTGVCHLLIKINTENNYICIRGFDNDPALLSQFFEPFVSIEGRNIPDWKKFLSVKENKQVLVLVNFFGDFIVKFNQSNPLVPPGNLYYIAGSRDGVFLRHTGQMHLLLYVLLQSMMSTVCSSW